MAASSRRSLPAANPSRPTARACWRCSNSVRACEQRSAATSARSRERFEQRGQLLPRERLALLLDPGAPFLELASLAGLGMDTPDLDAAACRAAASSPASASSSGVRCMVNASDSGIDAGALQPMGLDKQLRMQEIALENKLPYVQLVESAGANLMTYRVEDFVHGGSLFRNLARLSAAGLPVVTVTHGSSPPAAPTRPGLSDYIVMVRGRSRAFLAGPPLLKAATGEIATEEELGGAVMHTAISGLGDYLAEDDRDAIRIAREILAQHRLEPRLPARAAAPLRAAALRRRRAAGHHADRPQAAGRHARGDRAHRRRLRLPGLQRRLRHRHRLRPRAIEGHAGRHRHQQRPDRLGRRQQGRRTSSRPAASRARRWSTCTTRPATWSAARTRRPA